MAEPKKLEEKPKNGIAVKYADVFTRVEREHDVIDQIGEFDELRKKSTKAQLERLAKERHPTQYHYKAQRFFQNLEQEMGYFAGVKTHPGRFDDMKVDEQISMYATLGQKMMDDVINPDVE